MNSNLDTKYMYLNNETKMFLSCKNKGLGVITLFLINTFLSLILVCLMFSADFNPNEGTYRLNNYKEGNLLEQNIFYKDLIHINNNNHQLYVNDVVCLDTDMHMTKIRVECLRYNIDNVTNYYFVDLDDITYKHTCELCHNVLGNDLLKQFDNLKTQIASISSKFINPFLYIKTAYVVTFIFLFIIIIPIEMFNFNIKQKNDSLAIITKIYDNFFSSLKFYLTSGVVLHIVYLAISLYLMANY